MCSTSAPAPASTAARSSRRASPPTSWRRRTRSPASTSPARWASRCRSGARAAAARIKVLNARGHNLKNITAEIPLGLFTCVTGVSGGGKSTLLVDTLYAVGGAQAQQRLAGAGAARPHRGARAHRQDHRHRPVADRPHAALEPGDLHRRVHADPRMVRRPAGGQGARLRARPFLVQRQGRALRGLRGRRRHQDRDALPARRLRHLRRLQGQALQPRDPRRHLQEQVDRRRARHDGRRGAGVLQGGAAHPRRSWRRCSASASATSMSASRRRRCQAAKRSASSSPRSCRSARPAARSTFWTSPPPDCISTTWRSCSTCCTSWSRAATPWW